MLQFVLCGRPGNGKFTLSNKCIVSFANTFSIQVLWFTEMKYIINSTTQEYCVWITCKRQRNIQRMAFITNFLGIILYYAWTNFWTESCDFKTDIRNALFKLSSKLNWSCLYLCPMWLTFILSAKLNCFFITYAQCCLLLSILLISEPFLP